MKDYMKLEFESKSVNESFARVAVASFVARLNPTIEELAEIKTALSEAVTNSIIHGYKNKIGIVYIECELTENKVTITVSDNGGGIEDIAMARKPLFTTNPDGERSGIGFTVMETFMDSIEVESTYGEGTKIIMTKDIGNTEEGGSVE